MSVSVAVSIDVLVTGSIVLFIFVVWILRKFWRRWFAFVPPMNILPSCLWHRRARCIYVRICRHLPGRPHNLHCLRQRGRRLLLKLEGHWHLLLCPNLPCHRCARAVWRVGQYIPWWLYRASLCTNFHHPPFPFCRSGRFWGQTMEYLQPWPLLPPPLFLFVLVSFSKINLNNYLNTCIVCKLVRWDIK